MFSIDRRLYNRSASTMFAYQPRSELRWQTSQLKERFTAAKQIAQNLPGGDLSIAEQDELISLLERLRDERLCGLTLLSVSLELITHRKLLHIFSTTPVSTANRLS